MEACDTERSASRRLVAELMILANEAFALIGGGFFAIPLFKTLTPTENLWIIPSSQKDFDWHTWYYKEKLEARLLPDFMSTQPWMYRDLHTMQF